MPLLCFTDWTTSTLLSRDFTQRSAAYLRHASVLLVLGAASLSALASNVTLAVTPSASVGPVNAGTTVTLTATIKSGGSPVNPGVVNFFDTQAATPLIGTAQLTTAGIAAIRLIPGAGPHVYQATFLATKTVSGNTSGQVSLPITSAATYATTDVVTSSQGHRGIHSA